MDKDWIFLLMIVVIIIMNLIKKNARKSLNMEQKAALVDMYDKQKIQSYIGVVLIVIYFYLMINKVFDLEVISVVYLGLLLIYSLVYNSINYQKLKAQNFPEKYLKQTLFNNIVSIVILIVFCMYMLM